MENRDNIKTLLIGIGNEGREDDGLGWRFLDQISKMISNQTQIEYRYQLQIEDAELISEFDRVFFIDSTIQSTAEGFFFDRCHAKSTETLFSHALNPSNIVLLCHRLFEKNPECWVLGIEGRTWNLGQKLSKDGQRNLSYAKKFWIKKGYCLPLVDKS